MRRLCRHLEDAVDGRSVLMSLVCYAEAMTDSGLAVLTAMMDGEGRGVAWLRNTTRICSRKVRSAITGALLGGLVEDVTPDRVGINQHPAPMWRITDAGRAAVKELGV